ncbi:MAG TPA: hypothetical protein VJQ54_23445, partial [Candidatus Sulfotelmatobacter sp.]|nr:hypothetical protein [Candidatus Sulfotelmatobacter sp.]
CGSTRKGKKGTVPPVETSSTLILNVGNDAALLRSRTLLLQSRAYTVVSAYSIDDAMSRFREGDFDLVVLCHSIAPDETKQLICRVRDSGSATPVICVAAFSQSHPDPFATLTIGNSPDELFRAIDVALQRRLQFRITCGTLGWQEKPQPH